MLDSLKTDQGGLRVAVIGASGGIGSALVHHLASDGRIQTVFALSRKLPEKQLEKVSPLVLDLLDETSIQTACHSIGKSGELDLVIVATGLLHTSEIMPEKDWNKIKASNMAELFAINAIGPALIFKHFSSLLPNDRRSVIAAISARVGSISDNHLGGWYSYRASKAALNQIIRTFSIELARKKKEALIVGLHPGTVATRLSDPFQGNSKQRFTPEQSANYLLSVIGGLSTEHSGKVLDWEGKIVPE